MLGNGTVMDPCSGKMERIIWESGNAIGPRASVLRPTLMGPIIRYILSATLYTSHPSFLYREAWSSERSTCTKLDDFLVQGTFENDLRDGIGVYEFPDGLYYSVRTCVQ